jgi:hypothetical protein
MEARIDIEELTELLNIPEFERILYHKVEELKCVMADRISFYRNLKLKFRKTAYSTIQIYENGAPLKSPTYRFELDRREDGSWIPSIVEPYLPYQNDVERIIPGSVINCLVHCKTDPQKIYHLTVKDGCSKGSAADQTYRIEFSKYSDRHVMGTIRQDKGGEVEKTSCRKKSGIIDTNDQFEQIPDEVKYNELFYYMQKYSHLRYHIFSLFYMRLKADLDSPGSSAIYF